MRHSPRFARCSQCGADTGDAVRAAMKHNHEQLIWHCRLGLLMSGDSHAILAFPREPGMNAVVQNWKKYLARQEGVNWQGDFFDHRLRDHHELHEKPIRSCRIQSEGD